ncbi:hypothetical protein Acr_27g0004020 [Actinidia rufa]|uniref:Uncharacterized protein n=1 Tax=Actinidia rufa TaxID=165716 RepID=A0A7J0H6D5_9ERIC|nr:hypothetical protein Acr_27g0004020 [Actinidia rufa]
MDAATTVPVPPDEVELDSEESLETGDLVDEGSDFCGIGGGGEGRVVPELFVECGGGGELDFGSGEGDFFGAGDSSGGGGEGEVDSFGGGGESSGGGGGDTDWGGGDGGSGDGEEDSSGGGGGEDNSSGGGVVVVVKQKMMNFWWDHWPYHQIVKS